MRQFHSLAIHEPAGLLFGHAPIPCTTRSGLTFGAGTVIPEINFTLPTMFVDASTMDEVRRQYQEIIGGVTKRAIELEAPGLLVEFETVPPMTENPDWGMDLIHILLEGLDDARSKGLPCALRVTPNDTREMVRPPVMRSGGYLDDMLELFDRSAEAGADLLSIESVGGKEIHDEALTSGDLRQCIFALCVMGVRDMRYLWNRLAEVAAARGALCAGDTACGFANTAMVLAEQRMIPRVFAAVIRAVSAVRSLVAYECGAVGPGKDCGYENVYLKAITGYPMSMEGKTSACAHLSPVGNVAAAAADAWSNESVQNVKLLGGMAPVCYLEQLVYDCRLMNEALKDGKDRARQLRDWLVRSDALLDPQAYVLTPSAAVRVAGAIVAERNSYRAGVAAAKEAIALMREGVEQGLKIPTREMPWLERMECELLQVPESEEEFVKEMMREVGTTLFVAADYELN